MWGQEDIFYLSDAVSGVSKAPIRRQAMRAGVMQMAGLLYGEIRVVVEVFVPNLVRDAIVYSEHANRKTITAMDVIFALKYQGRSFYGFERCTL
ncbi:Histone H4 [Phytophthora megakarya]|uniref:Histone H4 n=1 Tax=Phytophthora megakarya TaxID=4795 RepID=A0A225WJA1_9STRA|nr:Histone H4 [Phytophthora megakarya]